MEVSQNFRNIFTPRMRNKGINMQFIHLHCHSHFSFYNGTASPEELVRRASELNMSALALTDYCNLYGTPEFCRAAKNHNIKPILGIEAIVAGYGLTLLAMNEEGWQNLMRLSSFALLESSHDTPTIDKELLDEYNAGLICLSGFAGGEVGRLLADDPTDGYEKAKVAARWYRDTFGDRYYLELRNHGIENQKTLFNHTVALGNELGILTVATNDIHYLDQGDWKARDILLCLKHEKTVFDKDRPKMESKQHYFHDADEMYAAFSEHEEACHRTVEIAERIEPDIFEKFYAKKYHPVFPLPPSKSADDLLRELCLDGLAKRYADSPFADEAKQRLETELTVIQKIGQANYFLIVGDIARFANKQGIYHTARGSAVGALICYVLGISHECPLEFGLLFERFLDENRIVSPDIDIDFEFERRKEIMDYVAKKYGKSNITGISTYDSFNAKSLIVEVGKALAIPYKKMESIIPLISEFSYRSTVAGVLQDSGELQKHYDNDTQIKGLLDLAQKFTRRPSKVGIHAVGIVIANVPLIDCMPLQKIEHTITTQWQPVDIERISGLKLDFLGHRTLTMLAKIVETIKETKGKTIELYKIPLDDYQTFDLFSQGNTIGVFQFESNGMRELLQRLKPSNFQDIAAIMALYRPGPLDGGMLDQFIDYKHGKQKAEYLHPVLEEILGETYGIMVYQEQIMQILHRLGNISFTDTYFCIKEIAKKKDFSKFREQFLTGIQEHSQSLAIGEEIFDMIVKFAGYAFNKSHSIAYARIAYITAYLKAHYPDEFTACVGNESLADF